MTARPSASGQLVPARQVVDMFATEALLALDRYGKSLPAGAPDGPQQTADRFAHWWRRLRLDDAWRGAGGTDAEQILAKAAELALDPGNDAGLSAEEAAAQANSVAAYKGRPMPLKAIADFRRDFAAAYGGKADLPEPEQWLVQSLTRLARASVLRDVVARGAQVQLSQPLRDAADDLARQGRELMDARRELGVRQQAQAGRESEARRGIWTVAGCVAYSLGVTATGAPPLAQLAMIAPALAVTVSETAKSWDALQAPAGPGLDPAQAELRSVRTDLVNTLSTPPPTTRRDTKALRNSPPHNPTHDR
jgi:hypothetical protein